jgi:hypothetical protein
MAGLRLTKIVRGRHAGVRVPSRVRPSDPLAALSQPLPSCVATGGATSGRSLI